LSQLVNHAHRFIRKVDLFRSCCSRIEQQFECGQLRISEVELVYSSSFLSVCAQWEALLEEVLFEAICGEESKKKSNRRLVKFSSKKHLEEILLFPSKKYLGLSSVKDASKLAALFVRKGMPISAIGMSRRSYLSEAVSIRNAIAHQGGYAMREFRRRVPGVLDLRPVKRFPGAFLRHQFRSSPSQRRCELYFAAFKAAANDLAEAW